MRDRPVEGFSTRDLLNAVSSQIDSLGLFSNFVIRIRNVLKKFGKSEGIKWNKTVLEKIGEEYESWRKELRQIKNVEIPELTLFYSIRD